MRLYERRVDRCSQKLHSGVQRRGSLRFSLHRLEHTRDQVDRHKICLDAALTPKDERAGHNPNSSTGSYFEIKGVYYGFKQSRHLDVQQLGIHEILNRNTIEFSMRFTFPPTKRARPRTTRLRTPQSWGHKCSIILRMMLQSFFRCSWMVTFPAEEASLFGPPLGPLKVGGWDLANAGVDR